LHIFQGFTRDTKPAPTTTTTEIRLSLTRSPSPPACCRKRPCFARHRRGTAPTPPSRCPDNIKEQHTNNSDEEVECFLTGSWGRRDGKGVKRTRIARTHARRASTCATGIGCDAGIYAVDGRGRHKMIREATGAGEQAGKVEAERFAKGGEETSTNWMDWLDGLTGRHGTHTKKYTTTHLVQAEVGKLLRGRDRGAGEEQESREGVDVPHRLDDLPRDAQEGQAEDEVGGQVRGKSPEEILLALGGWADGWDSSRGLNEKFFFLNLLAVFTFVSLSPVS